MQETLLEFSLSGGTYRSSKIPEENGTFWNINLLQILFLENKLDRGQTNPSEHCVISGLSSW